ncbi:hypothetical protein [Sinorhizobium sp. BG8]|uniref:hypothetical protein n=1 Tax=Sinorhizobium sp. BG8 TaxID=2613773 RepID=UPI00193DE173|nr:hypothetical protein [Sinorhizobium sp. BG8]QRM56207.1 hypothetical protein F3Y30_17930 [Sinorhizobium sp. BG8]
MCLRAVAGCFLMLPALATTAMSHDPDGWKYPLACCRGSEVDGDCHSIPDGDVMQGRRGYFILLRRGDHPKATRDHQFFVPYGDEIPSGDGAYHACLHPGEEHLNCFFAPPSLL